MVFHRVDFPNQPKLHKSKAVWFGNSLDEKDMYPYLYREMFGRHMSRDLCRTYILLGFSPLYLHQSRSLHLYFKIILEFDDINEKREKNLYLAIDKKKPVNSNKMNIEQGFQKLKGTILF